MKNIFLFLVILTLFQYPKENPSGAKENKALLKILSGTGDIEIRNLYYSLDSIKCGMEIGFEQFPVIYQVDSLINNLSEYSDFGSFVGSHRFNGYSSLLICRNYGDWFKTIETLNYDECGQMVGYYFNAAIGADEDYYYNATGRYLTDSTFLLAAITKDIVECDSSYIHYHIHKDGHVEKLSTSKYPC